MKRTILTVDDEPFFREEVVDFLRGATPATQVWEVDTAANGTEALEKLAQKPYDVVLLDINMPGLDGLEV